MCSDSEPPKLCIATGNHSLPAEEEPSKKLWVISEPESAAIHCRQKAKVAQQYLVRAENYLVVDIGGGTVDIASHGIVEEVPLMASWRRVVLNQLATSGVEQL